VFEPKNDRLLPGLLPYICQTDSFFEYAIGTSAGSLSPRTNWESLASYEFALPPLEEQQNIVNVLSMTDTAIDSIVNLIDVMDSFQISFIVDQLEKSNAPRLHLSAIANLERGCSYKSSDYVKERIGRPFLNLKSVTRDARFSPSGVKWVRNDFEPKCKIKIGDLFFANTDLTPGLLLVGAPFFFPGIKAKSEPCFSMDLTRVTPHGDTVKTRYLYYLLTIPRVRTRMRVLTCGSTVGHLQLDKVPDIEVPVLPGAEQNMFLKKMDGIESRRQSIVARAESTRAFRREILQSTFGEVANV
jgi:type I restriction enzyme S subunit